MSSFKNWKSLRVKLEGGFIYLKDLSDKRQQWGNVNNPYDTKIK